MSYANNAPSQNRSNNTLNYCLSRIRLLPTCYSALLLFKNVGFWRDFTLQRWNRMSRGYKKARFKSCIEKSQKLDEVAKTIAHSSFDLTLETIERELRHAGFTKEERNDSRLPLSHLEANEEKDETQHQAMSPREVGTCLVDRLGMGTEGTSHTYLH